MTQTAPGSIRNLKSVIPFCLAVLAVALMASNAFAQTSGDLHVQQVQGRVYMISGAGSNVAVQLGDEAVVVVDTGTAAMADKVLAEIRKLSSKPIEFVMNTSADADHTGGNGTIAKAGAKLSGADSNKTTANAGQVSDGASIVGYINVLNRMVDSGGKPGGSPKENWVTDPYDSSNWKVFNDEPIILYHAPAAHTDGDSFIFFRRSDVVSVGELFVPSRFPVIDEEKGGSIDGIIDALTTIIDDVLVPRENEEGGTYVIPGRGRICDRTDIVNYRDMLAIIRARIADLVKKGKTLQEVKDAKPTLGFDGLYGAQTGPWTTNMFIEAIYRNLTLTKDKKHK
jgi:glyoxylase-like metal-dependent hydrolase (beta-lactamase superfamily II)